MARETRHWDDARGGETAFMRGKEEAHDYRYFPDPDLGPIVIESLVDRIGMRCRNCLMPKAKGTCASGIYRSMMHPR